MKLMICGSMHFSKEMFEVKKELESLGHEVVLPTDAEECLVNPNLNMDLEYCLKTDIDKKGFDQLAENEGILILNYDKNHIKGYVGGATLMEIGIARHLNKKIYLMYDPPAEKDLRYSLEIKVAKPVILGGDLTKIA